MCLHPMVEFDASCKYQYGWVKFPAIASTQLRSIGKRIVWIMKYTIQQATDFQIKIKIALDYIMINRYFGRLQLEHLNSFKNHYCSFHINKKIWNISVYQCNTYFYKSPKVLRSRWSIFVQSSRRKMIQVPKNQIDEDMIRMRR